VTPKTGAVYRSGGCGVSTEDALQDFADLVSAVRGYAAPLRACSVPRFPEPRKRLSPCGNRHFSLEVANNQVSDRLHPPRTADWAETRQIG
jgi:hypothetical protein